MGQMGFFDVSKRYAGLDAKAALNIIRRSNLASALSCVRRS